MLRNCHPFKVVSPQYMVASTCVAMLIANVCDKFKGAILRRECDKIEMLQICPLPNLPMRSLGCYWKF